MAPECSYQARSDSEPCLEAQHHQVDTFRNPYYVDFL